MFDSDLAELYEVETGNLNKAVRRNLEKFPTDFCFQLTIEEFSFLKSRIITLNNDIDSKKPLRFQNGSSKQKKGGRRYLPYVFTEQGVAMLSGTLKSKKAIEINILIMRAFVHMRRFISENKEILSKLNNVENKLLNFENFKLESENNFNKIFTLLENSNSKPEKGIFFEGQLFDSYKFISDLIREAKTSVKLIDNYIDDRTLLLFNKRQKGVQVIIYTKEITSNLQEDLKKYNSQYETIELKKFNLSHDRFLIIDNQVYHIGASLKDIGKKWFGFSKMDESSLEILKRLDKLK